MSLYRRGETWWYSFVYAGKRIQESAKTSRKTLAAEAEKRRKLELERAHAGLPTEQKSRRIQSVADIIEPYLRTYGINHRPKSVLFAEGRLEHVKRLLGTVLMSDLTEDRIRRYIADRLAEGVGGRTINMELGELSRAVGQPWKTLWPKVRKLEERKDVGRALTPEERRVLLLKLKDSPAVLLKPIVEVALLTGMRSGEILSLTWRQVSLTDRTVSVGRAKTSSGSGRVIPLNGELCHVLAEHLAWYAKQFGEAKADWYVFPFGAPFPSDPTRPITDVKRAWGSLRKAAGIQCRFHDLRHTVATRMAEAGACRKERCWRCWGT